MTAVLMLDRRSHRPLTRQIYEGWRAAILSGRFHAGARVPSTRAFASTYGVARITVAAAYDQLLAEGYFQTRPGAGTFVSAELPDDLLRPPRVSTPAAASSSPRALRLSRYGARLGDIQRLPVPTERLNLSKVAPDLLRFPFSLWRRLVARRLGEPADTVFDQIAQPAGMAPLREAVAAHLARARAIRCTPDQIVIVSGSQQAIDLCCRILLDSGDEVAMEEPGYAGVRQLFGANGLSVKRLAVTDSGPAIDALTPRTRLVHVTPSHQFPTGVSMPLARRLELLEWARVHRAVILEDDYDSDFRYDGPPLPAMHSLADGSGVVYVGTFSNVMFRGLRIGYVVVPPDLVRPFTTAKWMADRHTSLLEQAALADFLTEGHFERHLRRMTKLYKQRRDVLLRALGEQFSGDIAIRGDAAGLHVTVTFRRGAGAVRERAARHGVQLTPTRIYYAGEAPTNEFIFGFAAIGERTIREGIRRIAGA